MKNTKRLMKSSLRSKRKGEGEGEGEGARREKTEEEDWGGENGGGALAIKVHLTLCRPHSKITSKSRHLSLTCHVGTYNISRVNEAWSKQTFMEHFIFKILFEHQYKN